MGIDYFGLASTALNIFGTVLANNAKADSYKVQQANLTGVYNANIANIEKMKAAVDVATSYNNAMLEKQIRRLGVESGVNQALEAAKAREDIATAIVKNAAAGYVHGSMDNFVRYEDSKAQMSVNNIARSYASQQYSVKDQQKINLVEAQLKKMELNNKANALTAQYNADMAGSVSNANANELANWLGLLNVGLKGASSLYPYSKPNTVNTSVSNYNMNSTWDNMFGV